MEHHHEHGHHHEHQQNTNSGLSLAFWLNLSFSIIELVGGIITNSTAIIADAFHDFMDAVAIGIAVFLEKISGRTRTAKFSYGYKRFSLLAALGMSVFLLVGAVLMIISAVRSFINPETVNSVGMLWLAVLGIAINGFAFLRVKKGGGHHHGHSHGHNHNSRAVMLHLLEDVLGWVAVLVGAAVMYFTGWYWIDGVLALGIAAFISYNAIRNLMDTMTVLLQSVPENVDIAALTTELGKLEGVESIHDLHVWSMDGSYNIGSLHAVLKADQLTMQDEVYRAIVKLTEKHHIQHPTIQFETAARNCSLTNC
ncbi:MAG: cation transporter [Pedobacter sp.]|nr:MAG: cation transporter [Pedobacter sp.]